MTEPTLLRRYAVPLAASAYVALVLLGKVAPWFLEQGVFFLYLLSLPLFLFVVLGLGFRGAYAMYRDRKAGRALRPRHATYVRTARCVVATCALALVLSWVLPNRLPYASDTLAFDAAAWRAEGAARYVKGDITPRQKMLGAVVRDVLPGRDRAQIQALLGPSENDRYTVEDSELVYELGPQRTPLGIDYEWLVIRFDGQGRYARHAIVGD